MGSLKRKSGSFWLRAVASLILAILTGACARSKPAGVGQDPASTGVRTVVDPPSSKALPPSGTAKVAEAEFDLPLFPGAVFDQSSLQRTEMGAFYQVHASFETSASTEVVAVFYRAKMKALAPTPDAFVETRQADKTTLMLKRDAHRLSLVAIEPREGTAGSDIQLSTTGARPAEVPKAPSKNP